MNNEADNYQELKFMEDIFPEDLLDNEGLGLLVLNEADEG